MQFNAPSFVTVDGRRLAYEEVCPPHPQGTVLLLTGLASKRQGWYQQINAFGQFYRTIALDHRDIGDSDPITEPYRIADQADDAAAVLQSLGVSQAAVVGISMGGFISLELTIRHPELVSRLVLTSTSAGGPTQIRAAPEILAMLKRPSNGREDPGITAQQSYAVIMAPGYADAHPEAMENTAAIARYRPQTGESYGRQLQAILGHDVTQRLGEIHVPTLVVHGDYDPLVPVGNGKYLAEHIPNARLIIYPNTGHITIVERAEEYNRDVLTFLSES